MRKASGLWLTGLFVLGLASGPAFAQGGEDLVEIKLSKDLAIPDFLDYITKATGKPILYDPAGQKVTKTSTLGSSLNHRVPRGASSTPSARSSPSTS